MTDRDLLERFRAGDTDAFAEIVEQHVTLLAQRATRRLPAALARRVAASDIVQEACLAAYLAHERFEGTGQAAIRAWLLGILDNKIKDVMRRHVGTQARSLRREETSLDDGRVAHDTDAPTPSQSVMAREATAKVRHAMARLPEDYREVLRLGWQEQLGHRDMARRLGRSYEATRKLHARALEALRKRLAQEREPA